MRHKQNIEHMSQSERLAVADSMAITISDIDSWAMVQRCVKPHISPPSLDRLNYAESAAKAYIKAASPGDPHLEDATFDLRIIESQKKLLRQGKRSGG